MINLNVLGLDIGGVNTKYAAVRMKEKSDFEILEVKSSYFPFWLEKERFIDVLLKIKEASKDLPLDAVGVTMTAELSDCFRTKREGVTWIAQSVENIFPGAYFLDLAGRAHKIEEVLKSPESFAASNWLTTALFVGKKFPTCLLIDIGSTTTDIVPIRAGIPIPIGKTDLERLCVGELVYTGALRTNVACVVSEIPIRGKTAQVASELFSTSGDVHLILGNITPSEFTCETADGRPATVQFAMERLARLVCADTETLSLEEIERIAAFIYEKQLEQIENGISQVASRLDTSCSVVVTGIGSTFLGVPAAKNHGLHHIIDLSDIVGFEASKTSSAVATAAIIGWQIMND
ncbi:MAG: hydantoinase/oxoprolinase family protein [Candidatus Heimdallarchaeota archaeon]